MLKNSVRIIGGKYRSRKLSFPDSLELRPTHDRVRETLFNWLAPFVVDSVCLDLFAGSGVLGFEALSRGAKWVSFVDKNREIVDQLASNQKLLKIENCEIIAAAIPSVLKLKQRAFNIVFLDPPYQSHLLAESVALLEQQQLVETGSLVYCETARGLDWSFLPDHWELYKESCTRTLEYRLLRLKND